MSISVTYTSAAENAKSTETEIVFKALYVLNEGITTEPTITDLSSWGVCTGSSTTTDGQFKGNFTNNKSDAYDILSVAITFVVSGAEELFAWGSISNGDILVKPGETKTLQFNPGEEYKKLVKKGSDPSAGLVAGDGIDITSNVVSAKIDNDSIKVDSEGALYVANSGVLKEDLTASIAIGSVYVGKTYLAGTSLEKVIRDMLTVSGDPTLMLHIDPDKTLYDAVTESIDSIKLIAEVVKESVDIARLDFYVNDEIVHTVSEGILEGGVFEYVYTPEEPIKTTTTFAATVTDMLGHDADQSILVTITGKTYNGTTPVIVSEVTEDIIKSLPMSELKETKTYEYSNITMDYGQILYCYPASLGDLTSIMDIAHNFEYIDSFTKSVVTVDGIDYNCYLLTNPVGADGVTLTFN
ncbi:MAG: hypothetical protein MJZ34_02345 [Paludibacteraceae bacterium]|nr:hypothetical protein [Paludibacteraceae bacterium]